LAISRGAVLALGRRDRAAATCDRAGVASLLDEARIERMASLATIGTPMVGITLGAPMGRATCVRL